MEVPSHFDDELILDLIETAQKWVMRFLLAFDSKSESEASDQIDVNNCLTSHPTYST